MKPGESFRTDEFVSGQNLHSGSWNCLRVTPAWLESARGFSSSWGVLLHQHARSRCVKVQRERGKCGFLKQELGSKREPLAGRGLCFNWFGLQGRLNNKNASMHPWEFSDLWPLWSLQVILWVWQQINSRINQRCTIIIIITISHGFYPF